MCTPVTFPVADNALNVNDEEVVTTDLNHPIDGTSGFGDLTGGDYLELHDLEFPLSPSSSSDNSSCVTMSSDEYFDSLDLLRDLEAEINRDQMQKDELCKLNLSTTNRPDELLKLPVSPEIRENQPSNSVKNQEANNRVEDESSSYKDKGKASSSKEMKGKQKNIKRKYFCFIPF